jgi:KaiC/GvpD/RAD55 family RecA-like ATPase
LADDRDESVRNSVRDALRDLGQNQSVLVIGAILDFIAERKPATAQQRLLVEVSLYRKVPETAQRRGGPRASRRCSQRCLL